MLDADRLAQVVEADRFGLLAVEHLAGGCVILMSRHACGGVVEDQHGAGGLVVHHVHQGVDACVEEGGVADQGNPVFDVILALCFLHAVQRGDGSAHAHCRVDDVQRRDCAECITPDIAGAVDAEFLQDGECAPVRTAGAEDRGTCRNLCGHGGLDLHAEDALADHVGAVLALQCKEFLADTVDPPRSDLLLDQRLKLLENIEFIDLGGKLFDQFPRQGVHKTKF